MSALQSHGYADAGVLAVSWARDVCPSNDTPRRQRGAFDDLLMYQTALGYNGIPHEPEVAYRPFYLCADELMESKEVAGPFRRDCYIGTERSSRRMRRGGFSRRLEPVALYIASNSVVQPGSRAKGARLGTRGHRRGF